MMTNYTLNACIGLLLSLTLISTGCGDFIDSQSPAAEELPVIPINCGDGVLQDGELCDDGENNSDSVLGACRLNCSYLMCVGATYEAIGDDGKAYCADDIVYSGDYQIDKYSDIQGLSGYTRLAGSLRISGAALSALSLATLRRVDGNLWIWNTGKLINADFPVLEEIAGDILIRNNINLKDFEMGKLGQVGGNVSIVFNSALPTCIAQGFTDLVGEANISGVISIDGNKPDSCD